MANERIICCCGASTWTKVIAWLYIGCCAGIIIVCALDLANKNATNADLVIELMVAIIGFPMGIILLKGSNDKRIGFLQAWLIYMVASILIAIIRSIIKIMDSNDSKGAGLAGLILVISLNTFFFAVVFVRMKEIREGV